MMWGLLVGTGGVRVGVGEGPSSHSYIHRDLCPLAERSAVVSLFFKEGLSGSAALECDSQRLGCLCRALPFCRQSAFVCR